MRANQTNEKVALWVSRVSHPFVISVLTLFLVTYSTGASLLESLLWPGLLLVVVMAPATIFITLAVRSGQFSDRDVSMRGERRSLFVLGGGCVLAYLLTLYFADAPQIVLASSWSAISAIAVAALVNQFVTKMSLHVLVTAGCAMILVYVSQSASIVAWVATGLVSWSRVKLGHHTVTQTILGWTVAIICTGAVFFLLT